METDNRRTSGLKSVMSILFITLAVLFLVLLFLLKDSMNNLISAKMKEQAGASVLKGISQYADSAFNYKINGESFHMTFLEFGATGCRSCRMMEKVMEKVRIAYPSEIKVKFLNVLQPANQDMMKYYGIAVIPTQVLLDITGKEVFRHTGYFSFDDLNKEFQKINF